VDAIVHNGALVNHAFSYVQLFEPNVLGTVEVIRLALRRRVARVSFVSTVGVASGLTRASAVREDEDAASLWQRRPIDSGYAVGYGTSKWADEILLRDLEARSGIPVTVFRCSMILPPRSFVGQVNAGDFLTRLLHGVVVTGLAPRSFYAEGSGRHHFDGLPVDFVARAIAAVTQAAPAGYGICHVVNGHAGDGISLDTLVDSVEKAGYAVRRIDDHAAWLRAFRERLEALGPLEQHRSALPILQQWEQPIRGELVFDNRRLTDRLAALAGGPVAIPDIDALFVQQYLKNMVYLGLIQHPGLSVAA
jgi:fatty acid CoA ligase FadD9